jgi:hypothetical protein
MREKLRERVERGEGVEEIGRWAVKQVLSLRDEEERVKHGDFETMLREGIGVVMECFETLNPDRVYSVFVRNQVLKECVLAKNTLETMGTISESLFFMFTDKCFRKLYSFYVKHQIIEESKVSAVLTVVQNKPMSPDSDIDYLLEANSTVLISGMFNSSGNREDNIFVVGCNKKDCFIDLNMYFSGESQEILMTITPSNKGFYLSDFSSGCVVGIKANKISLTPNSIFRLSNNVFIQVLHIRCGYHQSLTLKILLSSETFSTTNTEKAIFLGTDPENDFIIKGRGVGRKHCKIEYDLSTDDWILTDLNSKNCTWRVLKTEKQAITGSPSHPFLVYEPEYLLSIGPQKLKLNINLI